MKTILVPYHEEKAARAALKVAVLLAKRFESYVEGLLVLSKPMLTFVPGMIVPPDYLSAAVEEWRRFADRARREFAETTDANGLPLQELETPAKGLAAGWREMQGEETEVVGQHGRLFDLIVIGRPETSVSRRWREILEAALFEAGRPVLLAPAETLLTLGGNVVIAWNGSTEWRVRSHSACRSWLPPNVSRSSLWRDTPFPAPAAARLPPTSPDMVFQQPAEL